ncbi:unnamed protein product [Gongylonema pulchrum]|uniref:Macrophage migration inhibitory factor n=1 Tax=Gongylonema pulchrum TaxID=637853 RepID=A0A183EAD3_9BILA|nr:unnamed protein product [Gongylonema pulchrum]
MPHVTFFTNVARSRLPATFGKQFTELLAKSLNKPVNSVSLVLMPEALLSHGTSDCPTCLIVVSVFSSCFLEPQPIACSMYVRYLFGARPSGCLRPRGYHTCPWFHASTFLCRFFFI